MIRVCDAIMGQGKSSSAITYMNEHSDQKFIYITPYLEEAERIYENCSELHFVEPQKTYAHGNSKVNHTYELVMQNRNITTTHQAFKLYTPEMLNTIQRNEYTLIIDESVDFLEQCDIAEDDMELLVAGGYVECKDDIYMLVDDSYEGEWACDIIRLMRTREIMKSSAKVNGTESPFYYWMLSPELLTAFKDVFILTYLFQGQSMYHFMQMYNIEYTDIGITRELTSNGYIYRFCDEDDYIPEYVTHIRDMIEIVDDRKLNAIGAKENALSLNWFRNADDEKINQLRRNTYNVFRNVWNESDAADRMWASFKDMKEVLKGDGYSKAFTMFNQRATNELRNKLYLVYLCNVYMNVNEKKFFYRHGLKVNEDMYALSIMVQWIWRSAIRDGQKIYLYLPSSRMRRILEGWMNAIEKGGVRG